MARKTRQDAAKAKAAKQKKIAIGGGVLLVAILAIQGPRTMKMLNQHPKAPVTDASATTPTTTPASTPAPTDPNSLAAPSLAGPAPAATPAPAASADLVSAVPMSADPGQLETFSNFATKDPFAEQVPAGGSSSSGGSGSAASAGSAGKPGGSGTDGSHVSSPPEHSAAPAPASAVISVNGELMQVPAGSDFPIGGATASVFHLVSLTATTAKVSIAGGSYADGSAAITLRLKQPVTLQNTADGTRYTLILEPQGTTVTSTTSSPATATTPTTAPSSSVVPGSGSGG